MEEELLRPGGLREYLGSHIKRSGDGIERGHNIAKHLPSGRLRYYRSEIEKIAKAKSEHSS